MLCASPPFALGQSATDGAVRGRVLTDQGIAVKGAVVEVRSPDGVTERTAVCRPDGSFVVVGLPVGAHRVQAIAGPGLVAGASIQVEAGVVAELALTVRQQVLVPSAPAYDVETLLQGLPLRAREWESLAAVDSRANDADVANENPDQDRAEAPASTESYAGQAPAQNEQVVDGFTLRQSFRGGARGSYGGATGGVRTGASFAAGAIRSLRVQPGSFSAQASGAAGNIAIASEAGSAKLHGSAFFLVRESAWAATNPFSLVTHYKDGVISNALLKPSLREFQTGGSVGLAVPHTRERVKLFASAESLVRDDSVLASPSLLSFYALSANQTALLLNRGVKSAQINAALNYLDSLTGEIARLATRTQGFARLDVAASKRDTLTLAQIVQRLSAPAGAASGQTSEGVVARGTASVGDSNVAIDATTAHWIHTFSARARNELRAQLARDFEYESARTPLAQEPAISPGGFAPEVTIGGGLFAYGTPASLGRSAYPEENRIQVSDSLQWVAGHHLLTLGGDWSRVHDRIATTTNTEGTFRYDSVKATGLVDWITDFTFNVNAYPNGGCPSINATIHLFCFDSFTQSFGAPQTEFAMHEIAGFAEDSWRVREDLIVTAGVRYDYTLLPLPQIPNRSIDAIPGLGGATTSFPEDRNNIGPRLALAWSPLFGPKRLSWFTAHLSYGLFFGRLPGATVLAALTDTALPSSTTRIRITPKTETVCPQLASLTPAQGFGFPCAYTSAPPAAVAQTSSAIVFSRSFRIPAVQRANVEFEREAHIGPAKLLLKTSYAMAISHQLPSSVDQNIAPSSTFVTYSLQGGPGYSGIRSGQILRVPLYTARLANQYGPVTELVSDANATYHAATMETTLRLGSFEARGSYTFSCAIDYGPQLSAAPRNNSRFDPFTNGYDKGLSSLHFPQRFAGELIATASLHHGQRWLQHGISGWRIAAIATAGSGAPYSFTIYGGPSLSGGRESINGSGGATYLPSVGRNTLRMPMRGDLDVRLGREFTVGYGMRLNAFVEAFNLLNTENVSRIETRAFVVGDPVAGVTPLIFQDAAAVAGTSQPAFATPLSSTTGLSRERQLEVGLRLNF